MNIIWTNVALFLQHPPEALLDTLYYEHKTLEKNEKQPWKKYTKRTKVDLFQRLEDGSVAVPHGLLDRILRQCQKMNLTPVVTDQRVSFPAPKITMAHGFRFKQAQLFFDFLSHKRSGICQAPTRYGKTTLMINYLRVHPNVLSVVTAPGLDLVKQLHRDLSEALPERQVKLLSTAGSKVSQDINVCSMDSLDRCDPANVDLLIVDEPHAAVSPSRSKVFAQFTRARIVGFGATLTGRYDGADVMVEGLIGPVLSRRTYKEAVVEGAICPIIVYVLDVPFVPWDCDDRNQAYRALVYQNQDFVNQVVQIARRQIPEQWQTIFFVDEVKQADFMQVLLKEGVVAVACRMNGSERKEMFEQMRRGQIKRCMATDIYATGVTFPDLRVLVNTAGGGGSITAIQKPGRLAQTRPGKTAGYVIDFRHVPQMSQKPIRQDGGWQAVMRDDQARLRTYRETGFEIRHVNSCDKIQLI